LRGSGKSSFLEHVAENHLAQGHTIFDLFGCYDAETEVLTESGWKKFRELTYNDKISTLNSEGYIEYQNPTAIQVYYYKGKMIRFGGKKGHYDLLVTPNHNMLVRDYNGKLKFIKAYKILEYAETHKAHHLPFQFLRTAKWNGKDQEFINLPNPRYKRLPKQIYIDDFLRFFGWYLAEGSAYKNQDTYKIVLSINPLSLEERREVSQIISQMGFNPILDNGRVLLYSQRLFRIFKPLGHATEKFIPAWIKQLPSQRLKALLEALVKGDGHNYRTCQVYYTTSKKLADDVQEISIKCGLSSTVGISPPRKVCFRREKRTIISKEYYMVTISSSMNEPQISRKEITLEDYDGFVYCVTVPNHVILVRRNGKAVWCGNSRDGENLAWLRSPYAEKRILLLKGENVDVQASFPVKLASQLTLTDVQNYDIIISSSPLYHNIDEEFFNAARIVDLLYKRIHWRKLVFVVCREAANLFYSRLKVAENQALAKSEMIYLIREARHVGLSLGLDSVRFYSIDVDIRNLSDFLVLKSQGIFGLAYDLKWLYAYFNPAIVRTMPAANFIIITRKGALGLGEFPYPTWHKKERENILAEVGVKVEYAEAPKQAQFKGTFKTLSDQEHAELIRMYVEDLLGTVQIAEKLGRSSRTPVLHIQMHDSAVEKSGFCPICKRVQSPYQNVLAKKLKAEKMAEKK